jgi:hypothetical protein
MVPERRREPRYAARIVVRLQRHGEAVELCTENVSFRGLFLRSDTPPGVRQLIRFSLVLPNGVVIAAHAMVVHVIPPKSAGRAPGAGLQFWGSMEKANEWEQFVRDLADRHRIEAQTAAGPDKVRRSSQRMKVTLDVALGRESTVTRDVSESGMAIRCEARPPVGSSVCAVIRAGKRAYPIDVIVRRWIDEPGFRGLGVEYANLTPKARSALVAFIRAATPAEKVVIVKPGDPKLH